MTKHKKPKSGKRSADLGASAASARSPRSGIRKFRWDTDDKLSYSKLTEPISKPSNPRVSRAGGPSSLPSPSVDNDQPRHTAAPPPIPDGNLHPPLVACGSHLFPLPDAVAPPPPSYGFHNLERRNIVLLDGTARSYFALPPDEPMEPSFDKYHLYGPSGRHGSENWAELGHTTRHRRLSPEEFSRRPPSLHDYGRQDGEYYRPSKRPDGLLEAPEGGSSYLKRKYGEEDELAWRRPHVLHYGNLNGISFEFAQDCKDYLGPAAYHGEDMRFSKIPILDREGSEIPRIQRVQPEDVALVVLDVNPEAFTQAFLKLSKTVNENVIYKRNYLEDGKNAPLKCVVCGRASKEFACVHDLICHSYNSQNPDLQIDHLGLHKALCVLMGWNYSRVPEISKAYQLLSADEAEANRKDLILWPPTVIIHNHKGTRNNGRMASMGNREMDAMLKELGFGGGKPKSVHGRDGHTGVTVVRYPNTPAGLEEAERLAEYLEKNDCGRKDWSRVHASHFGDDDINPDLVKVDAETGERTRILYGYLATASDLDKIEVDMRKKAVIKSRKELDIRVVAQ